VAAMALVDCGVLGYDEPVASYWPEFANGDPGKAKLTVAEALSHRAGLPDMAGGMAGQIAASLWAWATSGRRWRAAWRTLVSATERASPAWEPGTFAAYHPISFSWILGGLMDSALKAPHRSASDSTKPASDSTKLANASSSAGQSAGQSLGVDLDESDPMGGPQPGSVSEAVRALVALPLGIPPSELLVGRAPVPGPRKAVGQAQGAESQSVDHLLAKLESAAAQVPSPGHWRKSQSFGGGGGGGGGGLTLKRWFELRVSAPLEGLLLALLLNAPFWRRLCLPSSNGLMTARAVGRVFGALANRGAAKPLEQGGKGSFAAFGTRGASRRSPAARRAGPREREEEEEGEEEGGEEEQRVVSAGCLAGVAARMRSSCDPAKPPEVRWEHPDGDESEAPGARARMSCGFFPWASEPLHGMCGRTGVVFNHEAMGGQMAYADPKSGLAVCVLKNSYEPLCVLGGSVSPDACEIAAAIRKALRVE